MSVMQAIRRKGPFHSIPYTRGSLIAPSSVVVVDSQVGVDQHGGASGTQGELQVTGTFEVVKITEQAFATVGATVYWNATADPAVGDAETGAVTANVEDKVLGIVEEPATEDAERVMIRLATDITPTS